MSKRNNQPSSNINPKKQKLESSNNGFNGFAQPNRVGISNNRQSKYYKIMNICNLNLFCCRFWP